MGMAVYKMDFFLHQAHLSMAWWEDMLGAAVSILNSLIRLYSKTERLRKKSPCQLVYKRKPDLSQWPGPPGAGVFVHIEGAKANPGQAKSQQAILVRPAGALEPSESGWLVRCLGSSSLRVTNHMSVLKDIDSRLAMLVKSDTFRLGGRLYGRGLALTDQIRGLFSTTDRSPHDLLTVHDPLTNLPVKLVSARDKHGELLHVLEVHAPLLDTPAAGSAAATAGGDGGVPLQDADSPPASPARGMAAAPGAPGMRRGAVGGSRSCQMGRLRAAPMTRGSGNVLAAAASTMPTAVLAKAARLRRRRRQHSSLEQEVAR